MLFTLLIYTKCNYVYSVTYPTWCHGIKKVDGYFRLAKRIDGTAEYRKIAKHGKSPTCKVHG